MLSEVLVQDTDALKLSNALRIRLCETGKASVDAIGRNSSSTAFRSVVKTNQYLSKILDPVEAGVAFMPEFVRIDDGALTRFHVRVIDKSKVKPVKDKDILLAPKDPDTISKLGSAIKRSVMLNGFAKMAGIGRDSVNSMVKALTRANSFIAQDVEEETISESERIHIWAFTSVGGRLEKGATRDEEATTVTSDRLELVAGPAP